MYEKSDVGRFQSPAKKLRSSDFLAPAMGRALTLEVPSLFHPLSTSGGDRVWNSLLNLLSPIGSLGLLVMAFPNPSTQRSVPPPTVHFAFNPSSVLAGIVGGPGLHCLCTVIVFSMTGVIWPYIWRAGRI